MQQAGRCGVRYPRFDGAFGSRTVRLRFTGKICLLLLIHGINGRGFCMRQMPSSCLMFHDANILLRSNTFLPLHLPLLFWHKGTKGLSKSVAVTRGRSFGFASEAPTVPALVLVAIWWYPLITDRTARPSPHPTS